METCDCAGYRDKRWQLALAATALACIGHWRCCCGQKESAGKRTKQSCVSVHLLSHDLEERNVELIFSHPSANIKKIKEKLLIPGDSQDSKDPGIDPPARHPPAHATALSTNFFYSASTESTTTLTAYSMAVNPRPQPTMSIMDEFVVRFNDLAAHRDTSEKLIKVLSPPIQPCALSQS